MTTRRGFLGALGWPAASFALATLRAQGIAPALAARSDPARGGRSPDELARDESLWFEVQQAFDVDRSMINLNNGGVCPSPRSVMSALHRHLDFSNTAPAYALWQVLEPRRETARAGLARLFGCDPEEDAITRNASESHENLQLGLDLERGDEVLTTNQDYPRMITKRDVQIEILFCGSHSDMHTARNEWSSVMPTTYPCVPGHEIDGRVISVGTGVTAYRPGDLVGVGCLVDSDHTCPNCRDGLEQLCPNQILTFNSPDKHLGGVTYGGYSERIVVDEHFVLHIPTNLNPAGVAPLLCAGITTYSPINRWGDIKGKRVGVVGLGGLGHMGVKFARAFGAQVVVFTTSSGKKKDALRLGADEANELVQAPLAAGKRG